jgi:hypothetical protein
MWFKMWLSIFQLLCFNVLVYSVWEGEGVFMIRTSVMGFYVCVSVCVCVCARARSKLFLLCVITRFRRDVNEIFALVDVTHRRQVFTASWSA